ncbi:transcriptional regulator, TetR family [Albimonas donghaensis]|uniref:Transcriptional regulator, TetR family n=1 Tax=Albimonas donghaensis TaxID=356660 RepID=A0A1H2WUI8_9RHOB|nr:TetR/AcrR family transcriptional regulator [Albimonas donghaensis]SDW84290.1 transcriptional regulator, TetR family [Albimonas donghaensis]
MTDAAPPPRRLTRDAARARTRAALLDSAGRVFARAGYAGASVEAIAEEAGYSKGAVYSNFASKEALFLDLLARRKAEEKAMAEAALEAAGGDPLAALEAWAATAEAEADWALLAVELQLHARRIPNFAEAYEAQAAEQRAAFGRTFAALFAAAGKTPPAPPEALAEAVFAMAHGLALGPEAPRAPALLSLTLRSLIEAAPPA